jgi:hypothetical protein
MKYLKLTNIRLLEFRNHGSLTEGEKRIPWRSCGFLPSLVSKKTVQQFDGEEEIFYIPISDETKVAALVVKLTASREEGESAEIVVEVAGNDQEVWKKRREAKKRKQAVRAERKRKAISTEADLPEQE